MLVNLSHFDTKYIKFNVHSKIKYFKYASQINYAVKDKVLLLEFVLHLEGHS